MGLSFEEAADQVTREQQGADAGQQAAAGQPAEDPYALAAQQVHDDQAHEERLQGQLLNWRAANDKTDAGVRADVLRYSAASDLSPSFVEENLDAVKRKVDSQQVNWAAVAHRQPSLAKMLLEQPEMTPLVKDDAAQLGGIEWALKAPFRAFVDAVTEQGTVARQFQEARGAGSPENQAAIREAESQGSKDYGAETFLQKAYVGTAHLLPFLLGDMASRALGGFVGATIMGGEGAAAGGAAGAPVGGVGAAPGAGIFGVLGGLTGAGVGQFLGSGVFNYYESVGPMYWRLSQMKDASGKPMDPEVAQAFATGGALMTAGLMSGLMGKVGGQLPGVRQLLAKFGANTIEKVLLEQTTTQAVTAGLKRFGTHYLTGATMMAAQSALGAATDEAAKSYSGQPFEAHWDRVGSAAKQGFESGLQDMLLLSAIGPGREMLSDIGRARSSAEGAVRLQAMVNGAADSKLLERYPDGFRKAVETMKEKEGGVSNLYMPVEEWTRYWQSKKVDPGEMAAEVNEDGGKSYADAVATKGDVVIPAEKFLTKFGRTEHGEALLMDAKVRPDDLTPRQYGEEQEKLKERLREQAQVRGSDLEQGKRQVSDFIKKQAVEAGVDKEEAAANAKLVSEYAGTIALRLGVGVQEAAALGALGRLRILGPKGEAVAAATRARFKEFLSPAGVRFLNERLGTMSPEARAQEYFIDPVSGLRNRRVFDTTELPEGKQVAVITSPDVKGINDHPTAGGHDAANDFLRAIGATVGEGHEEASRGGTNFLLHVTDQAELDQVLERVRNKLGNDKLNVVGALGENEKAAFDSLDKRTEQLRAEKALPARGALHPELDVGKLAFGPERAAGRVPEHLVKEIGALSDVDYAKKAYLDTIEVDGKPTKTGLLTADGWRALPRKAHVASIDLRGLKAANDTYGKEIGNKMLFAFADVLAHLGGSSFDAAHLSGDEFAVQHNDPIELERFVARIRKALPDAALRLRDATSGKTEVVPVDFRHGIGRDYGQADRALNTGKRAEAAMAGSPGDRGQADHGLRGRPPDVPQEAEGAPGGAGPAGSGDGRGATRQGFGDEVVASIEGLPVKYNAGAGERGFIQMQLDPSGKPRAFDIRILAGDRSTLAHETAHFLSWSLHDIATSDLASPDVRTDYGTLLKWAGYESADQRVTETKERADLSRLEQRTPEQEARLKTLTAKEERISHGWEQYLMEGKAPSEGLRRVFSKFKDWMLRIYKGVAGIQATYLEQHGQELGLSDDVRGVFDRMLAADDALQQANSDTGAVTPPPLLTGAMTTEERDQYRKALVEARLSAEAELDRRRGELENNKMTEVRARTTVEAAAELDRQPVYRAMRYLQRGEAVDAQGAPVDLPDALKNEEGQAYKLNRAAFVAAHGADAARLMPAGIFARAKKAGVPVEQLAPLLGFEAADDMISALTQAEPREAALRRLVQDRMDQAYGSVAHQMTDVAMSAVHNADRARATLLEARAMAKSIDPGVASRARSIDLDTLRASADRLVRGTAVGELDPDHFARVERKTALSAAELWGKGKKPEALEQKEANLFNQLLYRAARDAKEELEKAHDKLANTSEDIRATLGKADPAFRDVHDQIIAAVGLGQPVAEPRTVDQLAKVAEDNAQALDFDLDSIRQLIEKPQEWESLTVDDARNAVDAVKNIRHLARQVNELELVGKKLTRDAWFKDFGEHLAKRKALPPEPFDKAAQGLMSKVKHLGRGADAMLTDVAESYAHTLDTGDREGPVHQLLVDARLEARDRETKLSRDVLLKIQEKWDGIPKDVRNLGDKLVDVGKLLPVPPGTAGRVAPVYTRGTLWMLFLNWGNEGNRQRIRDGMGWSDDNATTALKMLTKPELKFLQGVLDTVNGLYPELAAVHEKRTGLKLDPVAASPFTINGEEYAGGYFPLRYRADLSRPGELQEGNTIASLFAPNYVRPSVARPHAKKRLEKVDAPVDLTWGVVPAHLAQVIHDITYGEWVRQTGSILMDPRFRALSEEHLGRERAKEFVPWLRDVANAKADSASAAQSDFLQQVGAFARSRAAVAVMGMNLPAILPQVLDPWNAFQENVPARHIATAYVKVNSYLAGAIDLPELQLSKELAYRDQALKSNLREQLAKMGPTGRGLSHVVSEVSFALYELSDKYTSRVTWKAAFDHAQSDGFADDEAAQRADDVVRRAYASHDIAEKPPLMRSKRGAAAAVMFYGFANRLYNSLRRTVTDTRMAFGSEDATTGDRVSAVARVAAKWMVMGLTGAAFSYLSGRGPKKDEDWEKWLAWRVALEPSNTSPLLGSALEGLVVKGQAVHMRTAPELALMEDVIKRLNDSVQKAKSAKGQSAVIASVEALIGGSLALYGAPVGQMARSGDYAQQLSTGEARPRRGAAGALDVASGLYYGKRKDQPRNPLTDLGDLVQ